MNVYPFINAEKQISQVGRGGNVARVCALLKVSRSAYSAHAAVQAAGGSPRQGHRVGRADPVPPRGRRATIPDPNAKARADLIGRDFTVDPNKINTRWVRGQQVRADLGGWLYMGTVIDIASRRVVGWPPPTTYAPTWSNTPCARPSPAAAHRLG